MLRVTQFSDTHFAGPAERSHGGLGYDTDETWQAVLADATRRGLGDLVVVTGDVTDHGRPEEYAKAAAAFAQLDAPVYLLPGNHDRQLEFEAMLPRPGLTMTKSLRVGSWLFVFVDSNAGGRELGPDGRLRDRPGRVHEANGLLGSAEASWLSDMVATTDADHVFVWVHHPPAMSGAFAQPVYDAELQALAPGLAKVRGLGGGHVHTDLVTAIAGIAVHVCPSLTLNFDLSNWRLLPPGYRTYELSDDGTVASEGHLLDDPRWPRHPLPDGVIRFLKGEFGWEEMLRRFGTDRRSD